MILDEHMRAAGLRYAVMPTWELYRCSRFCFHVRGHCTASGLLTAEVLVP